MKKKTHEEYVNEVAIKNPNVEVVGTYVDAKTKITHRCKIHNVYWDALSNNILKGKGCSECMKDKNRKRFSKNHEEYVKQVSRVNKNIEVLGNYVNSRTPILHKCNKHDIEWMALPSSILAGCGCCECGKEKRVSKTRKSHDKYVEELSIINPNIKVLEEYKGTKVPILHRCKKHDVSWRIEPYNALMGKGCFKCRNEKMRISLGKTHDEFVKEVENVNPNIEVVGRYVNSKTQIEFHCLIHDIHWVTFPYNVLKGHGCVECGKDKTRKRKLISHDEYVERLKLINEKIEVIEKYINMKTPILHKCLIHNIEWITTPMSVLQECGCLKCRSEKIRKKLIKTHEKYTKDISNVLPHIKVIGEYIDSHTKITHYCLKHDVFWDSSPANILQGCGCPKCAKEKNVENTIKTHEKYVSELSIANPTVEVVEKYINSQTPIMHHCLIHDVYWKIRPRNALKGVRCRECQKNTLKEQKTKTHEQYVNDVLNINKDIIVIDKYVKANTSILHKCKICGNEWYAKPNNILSGKGCPQCNESRGERQVRQYLESYVIQYEFQKVFNDCKDINPLPFDFYLPKFNVAIEYQGYQHYNSVDYFGGEEALKKRQKHDEIKRDYCKANNIHLLEIPYYKNVEEELNNFLFI